MSEPTPREIHTILAAHVEPRDPSWLIEEPMIPLHGITVVAGFRAASKTTWACWLTAQVTAMGKSVLFASLEDDLGEFLRPRVEAAGSDLQLVHFQDELQDRLHLPRDIVALGSFVQRHDVRLLILDPLGAAVPGFVSPGRIRDALMPLGQLSRVLGCAVVIVHHFRKAAGPDAFAAIGGSGAITDAARAVYVYGEALRDPFDALLGLSGHGRDEDGDYELEEGEEERVLAPLKLSAQRRPEALAFKFHAVQLPGLVNAVPRVTLLGETRANADMIVAAGRIRDVDPTQQTMVEQAVQWLLGLLVDGEQKSADLVPAAKAEGFSSRSVERARAEMKRKNLTVTFKRGDAWWVRLNVPEGPPA